ncbi:MAG: 2OG-Fe(II) oxygenase family protein [Pseudomonadota bacterium]
MYIPIIDFSPGRPKKTLINEVSKALHETGFMALRNAGVQLSTIKAAFAASRAFFEQDEQFKRRFLYRNAQENFGYQGLAMESLNPGLPGDLKQTFTMRLNPQSNIDESRFPSKAFRSATANFYAECMTSAMRILGVFAEAFDLPEGYFEDTVSGENVALRLLYYPQSKGPRIENQIGAGAHTDYGILTLLFQSDVSGLEVRDSNGDWQPVPCIPDTVLINTGDLMQHWTNNHFRSTEHRVLPITDGPDRYSIAFFVDPDSETLVDALPQCIDEKHPSTYKAITAGEHIRRKLEQSHNL